MEYIVRTCLPFDEIEAQTVEALERQGLTVQRTFSLHSAVGPKEEMGASTSHDHSAALGGKPGYSVLMLYAAGTLRQPLGLITLYERGDRIVINPVLTPLDNWLLSSAEVGKAPTRRGPDAEAELVAALIRGGLDLRLYVVSEGECSGPGMNDQELASSTRMVQDPVCGNWLERERSVAGIEYQGEMYYVCCPLCRDAFDSDPDRYARTG
jgi:YHS domain-containing protein